MRAAARAVALKDVLDDGTSGFWTSEKAQLSEWLHRIARRSG